DFDDRLIGVDDAKVENGVHLDGNVILGDHVLRWDVPGDGAQIDSNPALDHRKYVNDPGTAVGYQTTETKDHRSFEFLQHLQPAQHERRGNQDERSKWSEHPYDPLFHQRAAGAARSALRRTRTRRPSTPTTSTVAPTSSGSSATASQYSPWTNT